MITMRPNTATNLRDPCALDKACHPAMPHIHGAHALHHHHHDDAESRARIERSTRALRAALVITLALLVAEAVGGWISNSLALLADAGHVLTDVGALALSLFVAWFSRQPVTPE